MTSLPERVLSRVPPGPVMLALSGGLDSTALLHILATRGDVTATHVHHGLRPEADADASFCLELCERLGLGLHVVRLDLPRSAGSLQHRARLARYAALARVARVVGARDVVTGHHQDDALETAALMWTRGAGAHGLSSMTRASSDYPIEMPGLRLLRPMLGVRRAELEGWVRAQGIGWVEDASNASDAYTRNKLRHHVLGPWLEAPGARAGALATLDLLRADADALDALARALLEHHAHWSASGHVRLSLEAAGAQDSVLARMWGMIARALGTRPRWTATHRATLTELLRDPKDTRSVHLAGARACVSRGAVVVEATRARGARDLDLREAAPIALGSPRAQPWFEGTLTLGVGTAALPAALLEDGLELRGPRHGDRTRRGRKLGEMLRDLGVHRTQRWRWPCIGRSSDGALIWAVGDEDPGGDVPMGWTWRHGRRD